MITSVEFWPRWRAEAEHFTENQAVISITDPGQAPAKIRGEPALLRLEFFDLTAPVQGDKRYSERSLFNDELAASLVSFLETVVASPNRRQIVVHCEAGVSRSPAICLFVAAFAGCEFTMRDKADLANKFVLEVLSAHTGLPLERPPAFVPKAGILLL